MALSHHHHHYYSMISSPFSNYHPIIISIIVGEITINELIAIKSHEILVNHHESTIKSPWLSHFLQTAPSSNGRRLTGPFLGPGS